jgi:ATP-dependent DNA helicase RecG
LIKNNPSITINELSASLVLTIIGVKWNLKKLKLLGKIKRVGTNKGRHWEVIE